MTLPSTFVSNYSTIRFNNPQAQIPTYGAITAPLSLINTRLIAPHPVGTHKSQLHFSPAVSLASPPLQRPLNSLLMSAAHRDDQPSSDDALTQSAAQLLSDAGLFDTPESIPPHFELYCQQTDQALDNVRHLVENGEMSKEKAVQFQSLLVKVGQEVINAPIVANNQYLTRFSQGGLTKAQARHEIQQFSVFAFQFNAAQARLIANADHFEDWIESSKILINENGVPFQKGFDGDLSNKFDFNFNHHIWLKDMAEDLGLSFEEIGSTKVASEGAKKFVDAIFTYYPHEDRNTALGATFAIENWAANNLWKPWIKGMKDYNAQLPQGEKKVRLGYLTYHDKEERFHSQATIKELLESFNEEGFDERIFLESAKKMLNEGVQAYYEAQLANMPDKNESWPKSAC